MNVSPPPRKPPRGVKPVKENSRLLMNVIRVLSTSESNEQREREKNNLEREYKKSDQQLNELVSKHELDLTKVMQLFGQISSRIALTRDKLHEIKEVLVASKTLLSCRRDELKKLWLEGVEQKYILKLLEEIEQMKAVPSKLGIHLANKEYLSAAKLLESALNVGDGILEGVEALGELKTELHHKKEKLYKQLIIEISRLIYVEPINELSVSSQDMSSSHEESEWCKRIIEASLNDSLSVQQPTSHNFEQELSVLIECLALLAQFPDAADSIKSRMQPEVVGVVNRVSSIVMNNNKEGVHPLLDLLDTLTEQFRLISKRFNALVNAFAEKSKSHHINGTFFQPNDMSSTIQSVLQLLLTDYLDIQNTTNESQQSPSYSDRIEDISLYFCRRRIQRPRKVPLFKFEYSSYFTINSKDHPPPNKSLAPFQSDRERGDKILVCPPNPSNITVIYSPFMKFTEEIEQDLGKSGERCDLNIFVNDYVKHVFLPREHTRIMLKIECATKSSDAWRTPISNVEVEKLNLSRPLLQSSVQVNDAINELIALLDALPLHKPEVLEMVVSLIRSYTETCYAAYRGIVQPEPEDKRLCSVSWLKDEDISRFLKSLPSWTNLQSQKPLNRFARPLKREDTADEESPEDIRQRNIKEAEILLTNLAEGGISLHEIISDPQQLSSLAQLQESMEWFAWRLQQIVGKLKKMNLSEANSAGIPPHLNSLNALSQEFEELANTCLLMLHLEVRVQCFHYLLPRNMNYSRNKGTPQDPDPKVLDLCRVLVTIDEALMPSLQSRKMKYVFEGLGYLISKILMSTVNYMDKVDEGVVHKMCRNIFTLQQTLSNITMSRDLSLDHARRYFQLFLLSPEDIINDVLDKGADYSIMEYTNVFQLICKTKSDLDEQARLERYLQRLTDVLGDAEVTV